MKKVFSGALIITAIFLASCSNRQVYDAIQGGEKLDCQKLPPVQYEECMRDHGQSYEAYERDRKALLEQKN